MALKQQQELKQLQRLSPLQMQVIKLIELNNVEIEERIKQEIEDNPAIETTDTELSSEDTDSPENLTQEEIILGDYLSDDDVPDYRLNFSSGKSEPDFTEFSYFDDKSLHDYLLEQIGLLDLDENKQIIAEYIIGNIDENGYLQRDLLSISNDLLFQQQMDVTPLQLEDMLYEIQDFDPAGVGARDLQECLLIQLRRLKHGYEADLAIKIIEEYFDEFTKKHYDKIIRQIGISQDDLRDVIEEIVSLNPKPGNTLGGSINGYEQYNSRFYCR